MATFKAEQVRKAEVYNISRWNVKGGWDEVSIDLGKTALDYIMNDGKYMVHVIINGNIHCFLSKGAKAFGLTKND